MAKRTQEQVEAAQMLRKYLKPGSTVYSVLRHVSSSGMTRRIDFYTVKGGQIVFLTGYIAKLVGYRRDYKNDGLVVQGCGMDMGFDVVYNLGRCLFPKGFIPAKAKRHGRNGADPNERDTDGGYALRNEWL